MDNNVVVVIGAGRSGTSLIMQILESLGMEVSKEMVGKKEHNPEGAYEDHDIYYLQDELLQYTTPDSMKPPENWLNDTFTINIMSKLKEILKSRVEQKKFIWGFKDPRTALFIPMWTQIFNSLDLVPKYILAVRNPEAVIISKKRQFNINEKISELFWLTKYTEALLYTGANCFIVHYEDWFTDKKENIAKGLVDYTGLTELNSDTNIKNILNNKIKAKLNRAGFEKYVINNEYVKKLYYALKECRGNDFNNEKLMGVIVECRDAMMAFDGWVFEAQRLNRLYIKNKLRVGYKKLEVQSNKYLKDFEVFKADNEKLQLQSNEYLKDLEVIKADNEKLVFQSNEYLKQLIDKNDEIENLKIKGSNKKPAGNKQLENLTGNNKQIRNKLEKENFELKTSASFRIGQIFVNAIAKPGINTILLPYNFIKITLEYIFVRKYL